VKPNADGAAMEIFAAGTLAKNSVNLKVRSRHNQLEAEKTPAKNVLKVAEKREKQAKTTDNPASGTMNRFATTMIRGIILK
jgi:hypothetical protein